MAESSRFSAYPTKVTNALQQSVQSAYDLSTGKVTSFTGLNSELSTYSYADALDRLTDAYPPGGGNTHFGYCDQETACGVGQAKSVTTTIKQNSCAQTSDAVKTNAVYDGLGRTAKTHQYDGGMGAITVQTLYDGMGRVSKVSNSGADGDAVLLHGHHIRFTSRKPTFCRFPSLKITNLWKRQLGHSRRSSVIRSRTPQPRADPKWLKQWCSVREEIVTTLP